MPKDKNGPTLPIPGLYELAKPKATLGSPDKRGYHWRIGEELPKLGEHSLAKHEIYDRYVARYVRTLTKRYVQTRFRLTIIDGFCGGGLYSYDGEVVNGSPLRLLTAIEMARAEILEERPGFDLDVDFVFVDENASHIAFLREQLQARGYGPQIDRKIRLVALPFEEAAPKLIGEIRAKGRAHHSLFFLDQYGWSDVKLATIREIMSSLANPEVILTFMVDALANLLCDRNSTIGALAALDFAREDVKELVAMKGMKGWKRLIQNKLYAHIQAQTGADFYTPFFVHPPESHRDYWLLHLSRHHQAREEIGNVYWEASNTMEHHGGAGFHALGFDPNVDYRHGMDTYTFDGDADERSKKELLRQIPPLLHAAWKNGGPVTKHSLFTSRANDTPVVGRLIDAAFAEMRDAGEVVILGQKKDKAGNVTGKTVRERATSYGWRDEIQLPRQPRLFSLFTKAA